jgi:capsular polysaccharide biosynthesis protein
MNKNLVSKHPLLDAITEKRRPPQNLQPCDSHLFQHEYSKFIEPCVATCLNNVDIVGPTWFQLPSLFPIDRYKPGFGKLSERKKRLISFKSIASSPREIDQALWIHDNWSGGYFHWLTDVCPKLLAWKSMHNFSLPLILPKEYSFFPFILKSLEILGYNYLWYESTERIFIRQLWIIGETAPSGNYRSLLINEVSKTITEHIIPTSEHNSLSIPTSIYISRKDAIKRHISNESQIRDVLVSNSVDLTLLAGRSLDDQVRTFRNCSLLISIHGNGLTNMLWMQPGSSIIEIRRFGDSFNNCYFSLASALGLHYYYILAPSVGGVNDTHIADLTVDPVLLDLTIKQAKENS